VLSRRLEETRVAHSAPAGRPCQVANRMGVVTFEPEAPIPVEDPIKRADEIMYQEKRRRKVARGEPEGRR
jgi:PleD family two-component response regulator